MKKILIASVGGSSELIVNAIVHAQADFVYFLSSTGKAGSDATVEKTIVPGADLAESRYAIERVLNPHDLRDVAAACARIEADLAERFAGEDLNVVANYTGGTRTMSAGLVALAQRRGWGAEWTEPPVRPWSGPVSRISLSAVTVFSHLELSCAQGLNVIIGENGTGKTHVLKCAYALLRAAEEAEIRLHVTDRGDKLERVLGGRVRSFFAGGGEASRVRIECERAQYERNEGIGTPASWHLPKWVNVRTRALFLPSREVLAMYSGFGEAYERRELSFDETYYDLCRELGQLELREPSPAFSAVLEELEGIIGGKVRLNFNSFVVDTKSWTIPALMVAEGHRKLASLAYLIKIGALSDDCILFWDEPDANLNPKLVRAMAQVIRKLAKAGVQIVVATHDYLLARELSMEAECHPSDVDTRFFSLHRASDGVAVEVESAESWGDLQQNPIFEAYAAHYDRERELFSGELPEEQP